MIGVKEIGWNREVLLNALEAPELNSTLGSHRLWFYPQKAWTTKEVVSMVYGTKLEVPNSPPWWTDGANVIPEGCTSSYCEIEQSDFLVLTSALSYKSGIVFFTNASEAEFDSTQNQYKITSGFAYITRQDGEPMSLCSEDNNKLSRMNIDSMVTVLSETKEGTLASIQSGFPVYPATLSSSLTQACLL